MGLCRCVSLLFRHKTNMRLCLSPPMKSVCPTNIQESACFFCSQLSHTRAACPDAQRQVCLQTGSVNQQPELVKTCLGACPIRLSNEIFQLPHVGVARAAFQFQPAAFPLLCFFLLPHRGRRRCDMDAKTCHLVFISTSEGGAPTSYRTAVTSSSCWSRVEKNCCLLPNK